MAIEKFPTIKSVFNFMKENGIGYSNIVYLAEKKGSYELVYIRNA